MRCLASLLYFAIVALCIFGADNAFALATPASGLRPAIEGSLNSGDPAVFNVTDYGAIPDDGLSDVAALQAAADAACATTGNKVIEIPAGDFNMGDATQTSFYNGSAMVIDSGCDDLTVKGAGRTATRLLASSSNGQAMIAVCNFNLSDCDDSDKTVTKNFTLSDLTFADLDPALHGSQNSGYAFAPAATGGTPAFGDPVSWDGGSAFLIEYDAARGLYVIGPNAPGAMAAPTGTLTSSAGWTAGTITSSAGLRTEGTHGLATKYVDGVVIERVGCLNISDECLDFKVASNNVLVQDFTATGVGQIGEGGSSISIDCTTSTTVNNFYIDGGTASLRASGGAIVVGSNCATTEDSPVTENVRILNGTLIDTSTDAADKIESGIGMTIADGSAVNPDVGPVVMQNIVVQNVNISGFPEALGFGGGASLGSGAVTLVNVNADGEYSDTSAWRNRLVMTRIENNTNTTTLRGIEYMSGSYVSTESGTDGLTIGHPFTMVSSEIEHTAYLNTAGDDCLQLESGPNLVSNSIFRTCGPGTSAGHRPVDTGAASFDTVVTGNLKAGGSASGTFATGAASPGTGCGGGLIAGGGVALCDNNLISP